jgi:hypothetical protein
MTFMPTAPAPGAAGSYSPPYLDLGCRKEATNQRLEQRLQLALHCIRQLVLERRQQPPVLLIHTQALQVRHVTAAVHISNKTQDTRNYQHMFSSSLALCPDMCCFLLRERTAQLVMLKIQNYGPGTAPP